MTKEETLQFAENNPVFSLATTWTMETNTKPKEYVEL